MSEDIKVKICGLSERSHVQSAVEAGAAYVGFNFFPKSPRYANYEKAADLALLVPPGVAKVGLTVNADDATLDQLVTRVPLDMLQLHGAESPERVSEVKARFGLPVMKVIGVRDAADLAALATYGKVADQIMVDAKPPKDAVLPGGNGVVFDWRLLVGLRWPVPWMLAGGLTPENVAEAIRLTGAKQVDVASGVESAPGVKDPERVRAFVAAARA